jgi:hypothetical protein
MLAAEVMNQGAAAAGAGRDNHFHAEARQQSLGGRVDLRSQRRLNATRQQRDSPKTTRSPGQSARIAFPGRPREQCVRWH